MMKKLHWICICVCISALASAFGLPTGSDAKSGIVVASKWGLSWVADSQYVVRAGLADSAVMPRSEARRLLLEMNSGRANNFGHNDWRVPTYRELLYLTRSGAPTDSIGAFSELSRFLADRSSSSPSEGMVFLWPVRGQALPSDFGSVVLFASNSMYLKQNATVISGDLVVNDASPGPTEACSGRELCVGISVTTSAASSVSADSIQIKSGADIQGEVFCNELDNNGSNPGLSCGPISLPVFASLPPFQADQPRAGAPDILVPIGDSIVLEPGDYGIIKVKKNGTARFTGGTYTVQEIDFGDANTILFDAPSVVRVAGKFAIDQNSVLGSDQGVAASEIVFYVNGINGNNGNLGATPRAAKVGVGVNFSANLYAPNGSLWLRQNSVSTGAFLARDLILGVGASASLDTAFGNQPPLADPQIVFTNGAAMITITLTGSDPEGGSLTFSIDSPPLNGILTDLTPIVPDPLIDPVTGEEVQPPTTSATVKYTPNTPAAEEEDSFTFKVTDPQGGMGTAVVQINPPPEGENPPPPPQADIEALDKTVETNTGVALAILLGAAAPEGVEVSFSIVSLPANGTLSTSGGTAIETVPFALADNSVTYTPNGGFTGTDFFDFEASGDVGGTPSSDQATITVLVEEQILLAPDFTVTTDRNTPVIIPIEGNPGGTVEGQAPPLSFRSRIILRATNLKGASVAGNVSDADGDGLGDGKDNLPGTTPELIAAGVDVNLGSGGPVEGVARIHAEFDMRPIPPNAFPSFVSATVTLTTEKGTEDSLDTNFFFGVAESTPGAPPVVPENQNGILEESDFEFPVFPFSIATMSVPAGAAVGEEGTFQFDVTSAVGSAVSQGFDYLVLQGRVNENLAGGGFQQGLQIRSSADGNVALGKEPQLELNTAEDVPIPLAFTILTLPLNGTLTNFDTGQVVQAGDIFFQETLLVYTPALNFAGNDSMSYEVAEGIVKDTSLVTIIVNATDNCFENGRPVGCAPGQ